jgi:hypothetical protein
MPRIEFQRHRLADPRAFGEPKRWHQAVGLVLAAVAIAWASQRLGFSLVVALLIFAVTVPLLRGGLFLVVFFAQLSRAKQQGMQVEHVSLEASEAGVNLRMGTASHTLSWDLVRIEPMPGAVLLHFREPLPSLGQSEPLMVPRTAFASDADFAAFSEELRALSSRASS